jgi:hypothetical protein
MDKSIFFYGMKYDRIPLMRENINEFWLITIHVLEKEDS